MKGLTKTLAWWFRPNTCTDRGCGYNQFGNDDKCAICRRPLGRAALQSEEGR